MTPVHWVIQENQGDSSTVRRLVEALESQGQVSHLVWLTKSPDVPPISGLPDDVPVVCYGQGFITRAIKHPRLGSGLFFDPLTFRWDAFGRGWNGAMLSSDGRVMTLAEARDLLRGSKAFIRPNSDSKIFDGGIYDSARLATITNHAAIPDTTPVVFASPVEVQVEWRFFVVDREIVGCSEYRRSGRFSKEGAVPRSAIDLAAELALQWSPADIYCLDLASTGNSVGVVEANCFNGSRFYGAAVERIVNAVNSYVSRRG